MGSRAKGGSGGSGSERGWRNERCRAAECTAEGRQSEGREWGRVKGGSEGRE
jgi:hypothetical protein